MVRRRLFREGSIVRQGQTLYQIDPSLYQAQVNQAVANVQSARASADAARARAARYKPLADMEAVSKQDYTDALSHPPGRAAIAQNRARYGPRKSISAIRAFRHRSAAASVFRQ